ncbi:MAG: tRNA (guanosine(46)-N7)-methyltransferase TrmB [Planctomycetota bacterium]
MPRSSIRLPSRQVDWSPWFRTTDQLPNLLNSRTLFGNDKPLEIEIGSGKGLFLAGASKENPERNFLGIEIADRYARHAAGRIASAHECYRQPDADPVSNGEADKRTVENLEPPPGNAIMVAGNAESIFADRIAPGSLEAVHVYFPDPWWKKRHRKRRVVNETSVANFSSSLRTGGRFHFWTDVLDYFEITIEMIAASTPGFGVPIPEDEAESEHELDYHTHFEKRSRENAIPVYRVRYEKREPA